MKRQTGNNTEYNTVKTKTPEKKEFSLKFFWITSGGNFSRRAFFFSLFGFIAVIYVILCTAGIIRFHEGLSMFIIACNAAFGFNYYKNEAGKKYEHGGSEPASCE